ncbi:MAG: MmgE/PrpD family protein [Gammaproteobacteria bacterium]|nr:MmgE/PrpD family protein [Gammaproteobacteria bacterium]
MFRREFGKICFGTLGTALLSREANAADTPAHAAGGFTDVHGVTEYVAKFVVDTGYDAIPHDVVELGKKSILDGFGLALAGSKAETGPLCIKYLDTIGALQGGAVIIGTSYKTSPQFAALVNGISIHADDFDDTQLAVAKDRVYGLLVHPTVPVLPAVLALGQQRKISGRDLLLAYHLGVEVECKIAEAISPRHYEDGFHSTGTCGPFGSAAACSKLLGFDVPKTLNAFGIAGSQSAGLRENFGTMTKPYQAGHAAESGLRSAYLADIGWTAAQQILEAQRGFFHAAGGSFDPGAIVGKLGAPWTFVTPGISLKPYPSGSLSHPAMSEMMRLIERYDIRPAQVVQVDVGANHAMTQALLHHQPKTGLEAKFSMEFCIASLLLYRKAGLAQFTNQVVQRPEVKDMVAKVKYYVDPEAEAAGFDKMTSILKITLKNGKVITGRANFGKGSPADPMTFQEAAAKFRGCAEYADWPKNKTDALIESVAALETAPDIARLAPLLSSESA